MGGGQRRTAGQTEQTEENQEKDLRTWALMPSGPVSKAGSRLYGTFTPFLGEKETKSSR